MAYDDWMPEHQDVWQNLPVNWGEMSASEVDYAEYMYEEGFQRYKGESTRKDKYFAREEFFRITGLDAGLFDWWGWREAMGYED